MDLIESLKFIDNALSQTRLVDDIRNMNEDDINGLHMGFGMWVRNNCGYWQDNGTDAVVHDVLKLNEAGFYIRGLEKLTTSKLLSESDSGINYNIYHPDNICGIILELYYNYLNEKFTLAEIEHIISLD